MTSDEALNERIEQLCEERGYTFKPWETTTLGGYRHWPMSLVARDHSGGDMATGATLEACPAWATGEDLRAAAACRRSGGAARGGWCLHRPPQTFY